MKIIAVANQKGGCGKTTTAINLAACLGKKERRVLLLDLDPQGHASLGFGVYSDDARDLYDVFTGEVKLEDIIIPDVFAGVDVVPATMTLAAAEHLPVRSDERDRQLEIHLAGLYLLGQVFGPDDIGARFLGLLRLVALGEDGDPNRLAGAVRQGDYTAHVLIGMARIDAQVHGDLDGLVEFRLGPLLDQLHRFRQWIGLVPINRRISRPESLSLACHDRYPTTSRPMERAEPAMMRAAASTSLAFRSAIFALAISRT